MFSRGVWLAVGLSLLAAGAEARLNSWQIGGSGLAWSGNDSSSVMIDFESAPTAIQPFYITPDRTVFTYLDNWSPWRISPHLGFGEGEQPRSWRDGDGDDATTANGTYLIDGDSTTYNPGGSATWNTCPFYTIDLAVPVPIFRFGFFTPSQGYKANGDPLREDAVPSFEVSIAAEGDPSWTNSTGYFRIGTMIADVQENFETDVRIDFPRQYVRYVRYKRKESLIDLDLAEATRSEDSSQGQVEMGTIGDFELFGEGVPRWTLYKTRIFDLDGEFNFGRLSWSTTPLRRIDGEDRVAPDADVAVEVEVRSGRDDDPNVYHEYTDKGLERVVPRDRYELKLRQPPPTWAGTQRGRPGRRASISYDTDNWTYWSLPFTRSGQPLNLRSGSHLQLRITLHSDEFDAFVRLDSLWIERAPLLARQIVGEVARRDDPQPARGFTEVELGEQTDFVYDLRAVFTGAQQQGFDGLRIRTEQLPRFGSLEMGEPLVPVEPQQTIAEDGALTIHLPQRISADRNEPVRVTFATELFVYAATFEGEVFDTAVESLPQPIEAGDATDAIATNSLRILGKSGEAPELIQDLTFSTSVLTPNGDGVNDQVEITYSLFRLPEEVPVSLEVRALDGRCVASLPVGDQTSGLQQVRWDGRTAQGALLPPGLYLVEVALQSESLTSHQLRPLGIAY